MNDSEKNAVLVLRIAQDLKVSEATIEAETVETLYNLIIRQHEKIEHLNNDLKAMRGAANSWKAEVQRICKKEFDNIEIDIEAVKFEAVREFAEKLKKFFTENFNSTGFEDFLVCFICTAIDELVEEMGCNDG